MWQHLESVESDSGHVALLSVALYAWLKKLSACFISLNTNLTKVAY